MEGKTLSSGLTILPTQRFRSSLVEDLPEECQIEVDVVNLLGGVEMQRQWTAKGMENSNFPPMKQVLREKEAVELRDGRHKYRPDRRFRVKCHNLGSVSGILADYFANDENGYHLSMAVVRMDDAVIHWQGIVKHFEQVVLQLGSKV